MRDLAAWNDFEVISVHPMSNKDAYQVTLEDAGVGIVVELPGRMDWDGSIVSRTVLDAIHKYRGSPPNAPGTSKPPGRR